LAKPAPKARKLGVRCIGSCTSFSSCAEAANNGQ